MPQEMSFPIDNFFPIYDLLHSQINPEERDKPIPEEELKILIDKITVLDKTGKDMVYIFTRIHSLRYSNSKLLDVPYGGQKVSTRMDNNNLICDVKFDLRNFPPVLNRMLSKFVELHLRKQQEDKLKSKVIV